MSIFDFSETNFSWQRPLGSYLKIQKLYSIIIRNKKYQINKSLKLKKKFLNVGCGPNPKDNFINLDYLWRLKVDICWDITRGIPFEDNTFEGIYTEHCLEHITFTECEKVLEEFYRVLTPKAIVRIIVPDAELYLDLYERSKRGEDVKFPYISNDKNFTPMMAVNKIFRDYGHLFLYDSMTLTMLLKKVGFVNIKQESYMQGKCNTLLIDTESRKIESLYIEAEK